MPHSSTQETPYRLVYGADAMIPIELSKPSLRVATMTEKSNELARRTVLDLIEEDRIKKRAIKL